MISGKILNQLGCRAGKHSWQKKAILSSHKDFVICLSASILLSYFSITNQSLWIDEGVTVRLASYPSYSELLHTQLFNTTDDTQSHLPFYISYIWGWAKIFGISEVSLRMANFPFLMILLLTIKWGSRVIFNDKWIWSIALVSPFIWFYMNEARPYIGLMAFSSLSFISFFIYLTEPTHRNRLIPWLCLLGVYFASGMVSFNIFLIPLFLLTLLIQYKFNRDKWIIFLKNWLWPILISIPFFIILCTWFVWAVIQRSSGDVIETNLTYIKNPGILNVLFSMYEFIGFLGLGPPRNIMRAAPVLNTFSSYVIPLSIGLIGWIVSFIVIVKSWYHDISGRIAILIKMFCIGIVIIFFICLLFHFRFWGRHLAMYFPIFLFIIIGSITDNPGIFRNNFHHRLALYLLVAIWLLSSVRLIYLPEYKKDDYRSAVSCAINAAGSMGSILWAADRNCGQYYGLTLFDELTPKRISKVTSSSIAAYAVDWDDEKIDKAIHSCDYPIVIVIGKPDIHDKYGTLTKFVEESKAQLVASPNAFKIYTILCLPQQ
jgi:hypothetical protein